MSEVAKLNAVKRSLAIAQRVTGSALSEAKKHAPAKSLAGGRRRRRSSGPKVGKKGSKKGSRKGRKHSRKGKK